MIDRKTLKQMAKDQIRGHIGTLILSYLIYTLIIGATGFTFVGPLLLSPPMYTGLLMMFMCLPGDEKPEVEMLFRPFKLMYLKSVLTMMLMGLLTLLWSMLFIVPGYIKAISYMFAPYIIIDNPEISAMDAISASKKLTEGHKMDLFALILSFIPWMLLCGITFGIATLYVGPYMQATITNAYFNLRSNAAANVAQEP